MSAGLEWLVEERTPEEELEYRRYLRRRIRQRKRRRQVMIARFIVGVTSIVLVFLIFFGIGKIFFSGGDGQKKVKPSATPFVVDVPEGYNDVYQKLYGQRGDFPQLDDILLSMERYPKDVLQMLANNMETIDFVSDYLKHVDDTEANGGITAEELQQEGIPLFQQWDRRWGYVTYGNNIIAINGCGPTCLSMVYTGLTGKGNYTPADMAGFCIENNYFDQESGTSWALMLNGARKLGLDSQRVEASKKSIKRCLKDGRPVIASMKPGDFTTTGHFIVLTGLTEEGKVNVNDPNNIGNSKKQWDLDRIVSQTKAAWSYAQER